MTFVQLVKVLIITDNLEERKKWGYYNFWRSWHSNQLPGQLQRWFGSYFQLQYNIQVDKLKFLPNCHGVCMRVRVSTCGWPSVQCLPGWQSQPLAWLYQYFQYFLPMFNLWFDEAHEASNCLTLFIILWAALTKLIIYIRFSHSSASYILSIYYWKCLLVANIMI